jgi:phage FluMu gp28-like protein
MPFRTYQKKIFDDKSKFIQILKSRQIGITTLLAFIALYNVIINGISTIIVSASQNQANNVMNMIEKIINEIIIGTGVTITSSTKTKKMFSNGCYLMALPSNPRTIRGFTGTVILDECAIMPNADEIYEAVLPTITTNSKYQLIISSTPLGQQGLFYNIWSDDTKYKNYSKHKIDINDAIADGFNVDIETLKNNYDSDSFNQEFLCEFIDESTAYYPYDLIKKSISEFDVNKITGEFYIGLDIGRTTDKTAVVIICKNNNIFHLIDIQTMKNCSFDEQFLTIKNAIGKYNPVEVFGDKTGLGMQLMEQLEQYDSRVKGFTFTQQSKTNLFTNMKKIIEKGSFKMNNEEDLVRQLHGVKRSVTSGNNVKFELQRDKFGHSDIVVALGLALLSAKEVCEPAIYII